MDGENNLNVLKSVKNHVYNFINSLKAFKI